jgi:hypothetical protein
MIQYCNSDVMYNTSTYKTEDYCLFYCLESYFTILPAASLLEGRWNERNLGGSGCGLILAFSWEGLRKTTKIPSQDSQCPSWHSNQAHPKYKFRAFPLSKLAWYHYLLACGTYCFHLFPSNAWLHHFKGQHLPLDLLLLCLYPCVLARPTSTPAAGCSYVSNIPATQDPVQLDMGTAGSQQC